MASATGQIIEFVPEVIKVKVVGCRKHKFPKKYAGRNVGVGTKYLCHKCGLTYEYKERVDSVTHGGNEEYGTMDRTRYWDEITTTSSQRRDGVLT